MKLLVGMVGLCLALSTRAADTIRSNEAANLHADPSAKIDSANVSTLREAWKIETDGPITHRPLVRDGRLYFADWKGVVTAADAKTGKVLWRKEVEKPQTDWGWYGFSGTGALGENTLFEASTEGNAFALNTETGEVLWKTRFVGEDKYAGNCGAILHHGGVVYIGVSSVEEGVTAKDKDYKPTVRGRVVALDAKTGKELWTFFLCEPPANGVSVWGACALDPETGTLFFGTGNNYTGEATRLSDSIVALDAKTGKLRWSRQVTAHDVWTIAEPYGPDYDFGTGPQLFESQQDGKTRKLVGIGQKSGVYSVFDRETGDLVWQATIGFGEIAGGIMADASVAGNRVYIWSNNSFRPPERLAKDFPMTVKALDAATGTPVWTVPMAQPASGGNTAGFVSKDVYFVGSIDGQVRAYSTKDGKKLWESPADRASSGSALTVDEDTLYFGAGLPKDYGGNDNKGYGVFAYKVSAQ